MLFNVTDITWDTTDDNGEVLCPVELCLPADEIIEADSEDDAIDALTDKHGFCIVSASITVV
jgi:hypothetical protein